MEYDEYMKWLSYFEHRPLGWREDHRASLIIASSGSKIKPESIFPSLQALKESANKFGEKVASNIKQSALYGLLLNAKGGDSTEFLKD